MDGQSECVIRALQNRRKHTDKGLRALVSGGQEIVRARRRGKIRRKANPIGKEFNATPPPRTGMAPSPTAFAHRGMFASRSSHAKPLRFPPVAKYRYLQKDKERRRLFLGQNGREKRDVPHGPPPAAPHPFPLRVNVEPVAPKTTALAVTNRWNGAMFK